jgi:hypothetical protein
VSGHLDLEVAERGFLRSRDRDLRVTIAVLDDGAGGFDGHTLGQVGEFHGDVFVEVRAALDADDGSLRVALLEGGQTGHTQIERVIGLPVERLLGFRISRSRSPRSALIAAAGRGNQRHSQQARACSHHEESPFEK